MIKKLFPHKIGKFSIKLRRRRGIQKESLAFFLPCAIFLAENKPFIGIRNREGNLCGKKRIILIERN